MSQKVFLCFKIAQGQPPVPYFKRYTIKISGGYQPSAGVIR